LNKIADKAWIGPREGIYWYVLQTWEAAQVAFKRMMRFYLSAPSAFAKKPNESDFSCQFYHGPIISFKSGKNYQDLRIETLNGVVIDEYRQQPPDLWPLVIRPMLAHKNGWADILSTPNGYEHFYDLFNAAKLDPEWATFHAPSTVAPWWTPKEVESARNSMSEDQFAQEILAEFREMGAGKVYLGHGQHNWREICPFSLDGSANDPNVLYAPFLPIVVGMDFNVNLICWELGQQRGNDWWWFDEIALKGSHTQEAVQVLISRVRGHKPGIILVGDATGKANKTSAVGQTDYTIIHKALRDAQIRFEDRTTDSNPPVKDRVNAINARLKAADGSVHLWYHRKNCHYLGRDFDRVSWKENANGAILDQTKDKELTHASDAAGYPVFTLGTEMQNEVGVMRILK
jgi:hypothetical protein